MATRSSLQLHRTCLGIWSLKVQPCHHPFSPPPSPRSHGQHAKFHQHSATRDLTLTEIIHIRNSCPAQPATVKQRATRSRIRHTGIPIQGSRGGRHAGIPIQASRGGRHTGIPIKANFTGHWRGRHPGIPLRIRPCRHRRHNAGIPFIECSWWVGRGFRSRGGGACQRVGHDFPRMAGAGSIGDCAALWEGQAHHGCL
jgi:hypothetical protein